jgi:hypothetical protein
MTLQSRLVATLTRARVHGMDPPLRGWPGVLCRSRSCTMWTCVSRSLPEDPFDGDDLAAIDTAGSRASGVDRSRAGAAEQVRGGPVGYATWRSRTPTAYNRLLMAAYRQAERDWLGGDA